MGQKGTSPRPRLGRAAPPVVRRGGRASPQAAIDARPRDTRRRVALPRGDGAHAGEPLALATRSRSRSTRGRGHQQSNTALRRRPTHAPTGRAPRAATPRLLPRHGGARARVRRGRRQRAPSGRRVWQSRGAAAAVFATPPAAEARAPSRLPLALRPAAHPSSNQRRHGRTGAPHARAAVGAPGAPHAARSRRARCTPALLPAASVIIDAQCFIGTPQKTASSPHAPAAAPAGPGAAAMTPHPAGRLLRNL